MVKKTKPKVTKKVTKKANNSPKLSETELGDLRLFLRAALGIVREKVPQKKSPGVVKHRGQVTGGDR